jgi:hypothetical protein
MQTDFLQFMYQAINDLLTQNLGFFDAMGQNLFRMFATILIAWYGIKSALSAASGKYTFQFDNFASLLLTIAFGLGIRKTGTGAWRSPRPNHPAHRGLQI